MLDVFYYVLLIKQWCQRNITNSWITHKDVLTLEPWWIKSNCLIYSSIKTNLFSDLSLAWFFQNCTHVGLYERY
ncbi:hypothetical protein [Candidatus Hodgkinia cicadicola]|uniref:hypothetical protein n=1 Tax=Candidatus Hodgkinia cicadicola TaxID=573658 RepID=UPI001788BF0A